MQNFFLLFFVIVIRTITWLLYILCLLTGSANKERQTDRQRWTYLILKAAKNAKSRFEREFEAVQCNEAKKLFVLFRGNADYDGEAAPHSPQGFRGLRSHSLCTSSWHCTRRGRHPLSDPTLFFFYLGKTNKRAHSRSLSTTAERELLSFKR